MNKTKIGRDTFLRKIIESIQQSRGSGAMVVGEAGLGKSAVADEVVLALGGSMRLIRIHASSALSDTPYGALVPLLGDITSADVESSIAIAKAFTDSLRLDGRDRMSETPLLLVVDDADQLDSSSAALLTQALVSHRARALITTKKAYDPGLDLLSEKYDGLLDRFYLEPLSQSEVHQVCQRVLGGSVSSSLSSSLELFSEGNPRRLRGLLSQMCHSGHIEASDGIWLLADPGRMQNGRHADLIAHRLAALPSRHREVLDIIALNEPISLTVLQSMEALDAVDSLMEDELIRITEEGERCVRPRNPIEAEAIRQLVPIGRSIHMRERVEKFLFPGKTNEEATLRGVVWSLECGATLPDDELLKSARAAIGLFDTASATMAAQAIKSPHHVCAAKVEIAYALYQEGRFAEALELLGSFRGDEQDLETLKRALVLRTLLAPDTDAADALLMEDLENWAAPVRATAANSSVEAAEAEPVLRIVELLSLARFLAKGDDGTAATRINEILHAAEAAGDPEPLLLALALEATCAIASGRPETAAELTGRAVQIMLEGGPGLGIYIGHVFTSHVAATVLCGRFAAAEEFLTQFSSASWRRLVRFAGPVDLARGIISLRRGHWEAGLEQVIGAVEAMQVRQQTHFVVMALGLASFIASLLGHSELSEKYVHRLDGMQNGGGAQARLLGSGFALAAGFERTGGPEAGRELNLLADRAESEGMYSAELELRLLALHCGNDAAVDRLGTLARRVEGSQAALVYDFVLAMKDGDVPRVQEVAADARRAHYIGIAITCLRWARDLAEKEGDKARIQEIQRNLAHVQPKMTASTEQSRRRLTKREREIVTMVMKGHTNAAVAAKLFLSIRTVEGHIYRAYEKLGINGRGELGDHHLN